MKSLIIIFLSIVLFSCSSSDDSAENNNENPWNPTGVVRFQDIAATGWYFNKEELTLEDGTIMEFPPSNCKAVSWFYIFTNFKSQNHEFIDNGSGTCVDDEISSSYYFSDLGGGFFNITYHIESSQQEGNLYELFKIFDEDFPTFGSSNNENVLIWVDDNVDEEYNGQRVSSKKLYFNRR